MGQFAALPGLLSAGGSLLGGLFGGDGGVGDANAANAALNAQIQGLFREMGQRESLRFREAQGLFQSRADNVIGDIERAEAGVGSTERNLTRGAVDRSSQNTAALKQGLISSGFKNSTIGANLQRGVNSSLEQNLTDISSQADRARSGLAQTKAGFRSQVEGDLANLPLLRNSSMQNRLMGFAGALENMAHVPSGQGDPGFGALGGQLGGLFGNLLGGGGGGSGGFAGLSGMNFGSGFA